MIKKLLFIFVLSIVSLGCIGQDTILVRVDSIWAATSDTTWTSGTYWSLLPKDTLIQDPNNPYLWFNEATYMGLDSTQYYYQVWNLSNMLGDYIDFQKHDTARVSESWSITKEPNLYDFYKWLLNKRK